MHTENKSICFRVVKAKCQLFVFRFMLSLYEDFLFLLFCKSNCEIMIQLWSNLRDVCSVNMRYVVSHASKWTVIKHPESQFVQKKHHMNSLQAIFHIFFLPFQHTRGTAVLENCMSKEVKQNF